MNQSSDNTQPLPADGTSPENGNDRQISRSLQNLTSNTSHDGNDTGTRAQKHRRTQSQSVVSPTNGNFLTVPELHSGANGGRQADSGDDDTYIVVRDNAVDIDDIYGGKEKLPPRLLVVSSKIRNSAIIRNAIHSNITYVQYNYDTITLDELRNLIGQTLGGKKVHSVALILSCSNHANSAIYLCSKDDRVLSKESYSDQSAIQDFFTMIVKQHMDCTQTGTRLDFLACTVYQHGDIRQLLEDMTGVLGVPVSAYKDFAAVDSGMKRSEENLRVSSVGEMYFRLEKLRNWSGRHQQTLAGFEKIRTVGKGAYGAAVLYKKKDDDYLVILKEINMHDLNAAERQLALNEVNVLAMLDHPNIISYYDSFEEDGVLMIEIEYADGGTLAQFLSSQEKALDEKDVLTMFQQIVAAIRHIHEHNILHRDLKTDNIFLTKEGIVKVGDFGISKMMSSAQKGALTVLGTPYYISPEMCEGKQYSFKSDIWALGCILYEMACLQKTFEGSNLPALVNKIMKGQFAPVKGNYSQGFKDLIMDMLSKEPEERPCANDIMYQHVPELMSQFKEETSDPEEELMMSTENISKKIKIRSVLYYMESATGNLTCFTDLPPRMKIRQMAVGPDHVIVVTTERQVFTWGEGSKGQLGHGDTTSRSRPELVDALKGKSISMACCGDGFSLFTSDNGLVLTCGDGSKGCLGHDDWSSTSKPRLIENLLSVDVVALACGPSHVVAVGSEGEVYAWGDNSSGQLGLGNEISQCQPEEVSISEPVVFRDVRCGNDGTMLLSDVGSVFACGSNENNKLGLNNRQGFLMAMKNIFTKTEVEGRNVLTPVRALARHRVLDISIGPHHTAVRVASGHVYTFGRNTEGQLGIGNTKASNTPVEVKPLQDKCVNRIQCGEHFTVASTRDHELYYWGLRFKMPSQQAVEDNTSRSSTNGSITNVSSSVISKDDIRLESITPRKASASNSRTHSSASVNSLNSGKEQQTVSGQDGSAAGPDADAVKAGEDVAPTTPSRQTSCDSVLSAANDSGVPTTPQEEFNPGFRPLSSVPRRSTSASSRENLKEKDKEKEREKGEREIMRDDCVVLLEPVEIIRIEQVNEKVLLGNFFCHGENLFVQLETTAPPPRRKALKKRSLRKRSRNKPQSESSDSQQHTASSREGGDDYSSEASDSRGSIPTWLREELVSLEVDGNDGNEADDTSDQSEDEMRLIDSSMSSIQINRELTPVKTVDKLTPRLGLSNKRSGDEQTPRNRTASNSTESVDLALDHLSDSSSSEATLGKGDGPVFEAKKNTQGKILITPQKCSTPPLSVKPKQSSGAVAKPLSRIRSQGRGRGKGHDTALKEQLAARGFVSDVTVKRREKDLMSELEQLKAEKSLAEEKIRQMEAEHRHRQEEMKQEVQKRAQEREQALQSEISRLKTELESRTSTLQDNQKAVQDLQTQLNQLQAEQQRMQMNGGTPQLAVAPPTPRSSKVCVIN
ncbi:uncharacterized protein LOC124117551 isoform X2 [Haliotis rufescens]|uniref:uncharacterized protein LOC124117551 isoform X2 n=1 Tax=Haliotis rufescens TaxID=6454 RepID=UPI00201F7098|nr:uncharacterized protein LOC124117551 isoform X2 [Haliotis rufescens]